MTVIIKLDAIWAYVESSDPGTHAFLHQNLKYRPDGYKHVWSFISRKWDGYNYVYDVRNNRFRRGLLPRVVKLLEDEGQHVTVSDKLNGNRTHKHKLNNTLLRPYAFQQQAVQAIKDNDIGIIVSPTGSGKSSIIALAVSELSCRTVILVTDIVLLDQMQQNLQRLFDQNIGMIGDGEFDLQEITVSTIQSLASIFKAKSVENSEKRLKLLTHLKDVDLVISDEAHLFGSESVSEVIQNFTHTSRFIGCSATPYGWGETSEKKSDLELEQHFGQVIFDARKLNFIDIGLKVPLHVMMHNYSAINKVYNQHKKKKRFGGEEIDWSKNYKECLNTEIITASDYHEMVSGLAFEKLAAGKSVFVYASHSIEYGQALAKYIPGVVLINGKTPRKERRAIYDAMRKKEQLALVSDLGGTGLDLPSLDCFILASDVRDIRQMKGRVERKAQNKDVGEFVDFKFDCNFLSKHSDIRLSQYEHDNNRVITL